VSWGSTEVSGVHSLFVLAATSDGAPLWVRAFGDPSIAYSAAVDPERGISLVGIGPSSACPSLQGELLAFDAARRWTREFPCGAGTIVSASPVAGIDAPIYVVGVLRGAFDFGAGTLTAAGDGRPFVLRLAP
jgi:hypothetical protein